MRNTSGREGRNRSAARSTEHPNPDKIFVFHGGLVCMVSTQQITHLDQDVCIEDED